VKDHAKIFYALTLFVLLSVIGLVIELIYYETLKNSLPEESTFLGLSFNLPAFVFGLTFILMVAGLALLFFYYPKIKKKAEKIRKRKQVL
jgi:chromate transport protein ChrA